MAAPGKGSRQIDIARAVHGAEPAALTSRTPIDYHGVMLALAKAKAARQLAIAATSGADYLQIPEGHNAAADAATREWIACIAFEALDDAIDEARPRVSQECRGPVRRRGVMASTHCRCCRALLAPANRGPLCDRCAGGRCRLGRVHRVTVVEVDGRVRRVSRGASTIAAKGGA